MTSLLIWHASDGEVVHRVEVARVERSDGGWRVVESLNGCTVMPFLSDATMSEIEALSIVEVDA